MIWITQSYKLFRDPNGLPLVQIGDPSEILWFCEGREASREEIMESIETGMPSLQSLADEEGEAAQKDLAKRYQELLKTIPI